MLEDIEVESLALVLQKSYINVQFKIVRRKKVVKFSGVPAPGINVFFEDIKTKLHVNNYEFLPFFQPFDSA